VNDQRRVLLAFLLMAVVLAFSQWWYSRMSPPEEAPPPAGVPTETAAPPPPPSPTETPAPTALPAVPAVVDNELLAGQPPPPSVIVQTPFYRLAIDPEGGSIEAIELTRYPSFTGPGPVQLVPETTSLLRRAADFGTERLALSDIGFAVSDTLLQLGASDPAQDLTLRYQSGQRAITQTYRFDPSGYVIDYELDVGSPVNGLLVTSLGPRLESNEKNTRDDYGQMRAVARVDGEVVSRQAKEVDEGEALALAGDVDWAGIRSKYFLAVVMAASEDEPLSAATMKGEASDSLPLVDVAVGAPIRGGRTKYRLYFGPQEYQRLSQLNEGLDDVSQYGWSWIRWMITPFAKLCVIIMLWLHKFIPSYGLVLMVFALLVRVVTWPLTTKSYQSIRAMQKLQPELQRIREQYKADPQRMQQETMALYREKKVNPLGGCLPNLIPMPILFALFFVFQSTIEFRGQPFLWLGDLSQPDPLYILPVFMGATIYASSKLTTTDPKMAAMTYVMPLVLTFVFLNLAAGLVLYYALSNMLTFVQQWWLKYSMGRTDGEAAEAAG
jgi:YidC/Oxa1 family membrane protein insertase